MLSLVLALMLATAFWLTIGWSVYRSAAEHRRDRIRERLSEELLGRLFEPDTTWEPWASQLSASERRVAKELLREYLGELEGDDADCLRDLGWTLGLVEEAGELLESRHEHERLQGLTWLTLLDDSGPYHQSAFEPETAFERAATVRLLTAVDDIDAGAAVDVLLRGAQTQFTVFGQDTLYQVAREDPSALLTRAVADYQEWPEPLLAQVLSVCRYLDAESIADALPWVIELLDHDSPVVRAAAVQTLGGAQLHQQDRDSIPIVDIVSDPSARVRGAGYEMLGAWGDEAALSVLLYALVSEDDPRALTRGAAELVAAEDAVGAEGPRVLGSAWTWSRKHREFDGAAPATLTTGD